MCRRVVFIPGLYNWGLARGKDAGDQHMHEVLLVHVISGIKHIHPAKRLCILGDMHEHYWLIVTHPLQPYPNMEYYEVSQSDECRIIVAMNYDYRCHFTVSVTVFDSVNTVSSRGALCTKDCIPPRHRWSTALCVSVY